MIIYGFMGKKPKVNAIFIDDTDMVDKGFVTIYSQNCEFELGTYNSKERALEVLDEIENLIGEDEYMHISQTKIYEMPKE